MIWLFLGCLFETPDPAQFSPEPGPPEVPVAQEEEEPIAPLVLPATPFPARNRVAPSTLVDESGGVTLVLEPLGVALEVLSLLPDRGWVKCIGCRSPVEGWLQREALQADTADLARAEDSLVAWLGAQDERTAEQRALLAHGVVPHGDSWKGPPWYREGGYTGPTLTLHEQDGEIVMDWTPVVEPTEGR